MLGVKGRVSRTKKPADKLNLLLGFTFAIYRWDCWMHDNEGGMGVIVKGLAGAWKRLLKKYSDEELGIDTAYTKPGILELLSQFKKEVESMEDYYEMGKFNYE